jgi:hypothetical protein
LGSDGPIRSNQKSDSQGERARALSAIVWGRILGFAVSKTPVPFAALQFALFLIVHGVSFRERGPFLRQVVKRKDGGHGTNRHTGPAIDALDRINVEHWNVGEVAFILTRVDTINRANVHASGVLGVDAGFSDNIGHVRSLLGAFLSS